MFFLINKFRQEHHWRLVDKVKRKFFLKYEILKILSKTCLKNSKLPIIYKYFIYIKLIKLIRFSNIGISKNRCILSGRSYGILSYFKVSRFFLRTNLIKMNTFGFRRLSW